MQNFVSNSETGSIHRGELPEGCRRCLQGEKSVLYATSRCAVGCYYCTIPDADKKKDIIGINEISLNGESDKISGIIEESNTCQSTGVGITGGDPLSRPHRTLEFISSLKEEYGGDYHIHLYTSGKYLHDKLLTQLVDAGLDELRIHPKELKDQDSMNKARIAKERFPDLVVGFEIPAIPGQKESILQIINFAVSSGLDFVNLNEFEFTESNFSDLDERSFVSVLSNSAVQGSREMIQEIFQKLEPTLPLTIHFCSSASKDSAQLTERYKKRAVTIARPFESISDDGQLEYGRLIAGSEDACNDLLQYLQTEYDIPRHLLELTKEGVIETSWIIVDQLIDGLKQVYPNLSGEILARHPIDDGPITWIDPR